MYIIINWIKGELMSDSSFNIIYFGGIFFIVVGFIFWLFYYHANKDAIDAISSRSNFKSEDSLLRREEWDNFHN